MSSVVTRAPSLYQRFVSFFRPEAEPAPPLPAPRTSAWRRVETSPTARGCYNFEATEEGQLSITVGDEVVIKAEADGWYLGLRNVSYFRFMCMNPDNVFVQTRWDQPEKGCFPKNVVSLVQASSLPIPQADSESPSTSNMILSPRSPLPLPPLPNRFDVVTRAMVVKVIYHFDSYGEGYMGLKAGEIIVVTKRGKGWMVGTKRVRLHCFITFIPTEFLSAVQRQL